MKPAYLKSYGPNNVAIISMIFESFVQGMKFLTENSPAVHSDWQVKEMEDGTRSGYLPSSTNWEDEAMWENFYNLIYTRWYFGCGGPGPIVLREVKEYGTALCQFDLD